MCISIVFALNAGKQQADAIKERVKQSGRVVWVWDCPEAGRTAARCRGRSFPDTFPTGNNF